MKNSTAAAIACAGAVIGAGFASGREVVSFFTRYGENAWWLILLAVTAMTALCGLCLMSARRCDAAHGWCAMFERDGTGAQICTLMLLMLTSGAMIAAAGSMAALVWAHPLAYSIGAAGTLMAAWALGGKGMRVLGGISAVLTCLLFCAAVLAMTCAPEAEDAVLAPPAADGRAALRAVGYAAMNVTLAIGVVCRCAHTGVENTRRFCVTFGAIMAVLLYTSNALYLRHPEVHSQPFPIVQLLRCFGREGFLLSVGLLYLSVFTTLTAVMCALRSAVQRHVRRPALRLLLALGLPLLASCAGFEGIVDRLYAPAGLVCLLLVFAPLAVSQIQRPAQERNS